MCENARHFSAYAADIWAAGVCLFTFTTGRLPFYSDNPSDLFRMILEDTIDYDNIIDVTGEKIHMSSKLRRLLQLILKKNPNERAGLGDCMSHSFLSLAVEQRHDILGTELERSKLRELIISEEDIRKAFATAKLADTTAIITKAAKLRSYLWRARSRLSEST